MLSPRLASVALWVPRIVGKRHLLSKAFALENEWSSRHVELVKLGLGGDYEWIGAVQKKFVGGGMASAIDVDAAVCIAEQKDQVPDIIDLVYKLRHSENAADLPPSAEYALIRLLLRYDPSLLFKLASDPINYGVFMNEHAASLAIDHFIKTENFAGAARLSAWVMQQEMTENELLNLLVLYSCSKWIELPVEEQVMPIEGSGENDISDEDVKTFKYPYLKNTHFDSHFDLIDPHDLAGKTLLWVARDSRSLPDSLRQSLKLLGAVLYKRLDLASSLACSSVHGSVAVIVRRMLTPKEGEEVTELHRQILDKLSSCVASEELISSAIYAVLEKILEKEEEALAKRQAEEFIAWHQRRRDLIKAQANRLLLKIRAEEIGKELTELEQQTEKLTFFEHRLKWEKKSAQNAEIIKQTAGDKSKKAAQ